MSEDKSQGSSDGNSERKNGASQGIAADAGEARYGVVFTLFVTTLIQSLTAMSSITIPVMAPVAIKELGVSTAAIGLFVGFSYAGAALSALVSGGFILRYGSMRVSQAALLVCATGLVLVTLAPVAFMPVVALILGAGYGPITPASSQVLAKTAPPHLRSRVFSIKQTGVPLGGALAGLLVPPLVLLFGWRGACLAVAAACAVMAFAAQPMRSTFDADRDAQHRVSVDNLRAPFTLIFSDKRLVLLSVIPFFYAGMQMCLMAYLVSYLKGDILLSLVTAGLVLSVANVCGVLGRVLWGVAADKTAQPLKILGGLGVAMAACSLLAAAFSPAWPVAAMFVVAGVFGATAIGWNGVHLAEVARVSPEGKAGVVTGGSAFFTFGGIMAIPPLFGLVQAQAGFGWAYALFALAPLAMGMYLLVRR
jgi:MFS family permease